MEEYQSFSLNEVLSLYDKFVKLEEGNKNLLIALTKENIRTAAEPAGSDVAQLEEDVASLKNQLLRLKTHNFTKELVAQRLQLTEVLNYILIKESTGMDKFSFDVTEKLDLAKEVMELKDLTKEIQEADAELLEAREIIFKLEKEANELKKQRQQLWNELTTPVEEITHPDSNVQERLRDFQKRVKDERQSTSLGRHILRNMIVGSKLNWAKDPNLLDILLPE